MIPLLAPEEIQASDRFLLQHENITSVELMERAGNRCAGWILNHFTKEETFSIICGKGNNGGDGLVIALNLVRAGYPVTVFIPPIDQFTNDDVRYFFNRATEIKITIKPYNEFFNIYNGVLIDALFGSGLNRLIEKEEKNIIHHTHKFKGTIVSIDLPSGMFVNEPIPAGQPVIKADYTLSISLPKLNFLIAQYGEYAGEIIDISIGLPGHYFNDKNFKTFLLEDRDMITLFKKRSPFSHKGNFGHALLLAGSKGKCGAAVLAAKGCLRSGVGLLTIQTGECNRVILQTSVPEAMFISDKQHDYISATEGIEKYKAIGIGPGIGTNADTASVVKYILTNAACPVVMDADAINILSENPTWFSFLPANCILTPHPVEFDRLCGKSASDYERLEKQKEFSAKYGCYIILKGHHSSLSTPDGSLLFNHTGNAGMATGGSGDVLTGILTGLLAQHYSTFAAAALGMMIHGKAGDRAAEQKSMTSLIAGDIAENLGSVFSELEYI